MQIIRGLTLSVSLLVFSPAVFAAQGGNGVGYIGPNRGGLAVPLNGEKSYSPAAVRQATNDCLDEMAIRLWERIYRAPFQATVDQRIIDDSRPTPIRNTPAIQELNYSNDSCEYSYQLSATGVLKFDLVTIVANRCRNAPTEVRVNSQGSVITFRWPASLPYLSAAQDETYELMLPKDEKGNLLAGSVALEDRENGSRVMFDLDRYSQCLQARLQ